MENENSRINARFNHTNIAVRSIVRYVQERLDCYCDCGIEFAEWTINMSKDQILRGMTVAEPDMVLFSTYIWNSEMVQKIIPDIKKILPHVGLKPVFVLNSGSENFPRLIS